MLADSQNYRKNAAEILKDLKSAEIEMPDLSTLRQLYSEQLSKHNGFSAAGIRCVVPAPLPATREADLSSRLDLTGSTVQALGPWTEAELLTEAALFDQSLSPSSFMLISGGSVLGMQVR